MSDSYFNSAGFDQRHYDHLKQRIAKLEAELAALREREKRMREVVRESLTYVDWYAKALDHQASRDFAEQARALLAEAEAGNE